MDKDHATDERVYFHWMRREVNLVHNELSPQFGKVTYFCARKI